MQTSWLPLRWAYSQTQLHGWLTWMAASGTTSKTSALLDSSETQVGWLEQLSATWFWVCFSIHDQNFLSKHTHDMQLLRSSAPSRESLRSHWEQQPQKMLGPLWMCSPLDSYGSDTRLSNGQVHDTTCMSNWQSDRRGNVAPCLCPFRRNLSFHDSCPCQQARTHGIEPFHWGDAEHLDKLKNKRPGLHLPAHTPVSLLQNSAPCWHLHLPWLQTLPQFPHRFHLMAKMAHHGLSLWFHPWQGHGHHRFSRTSLSCPKCIPERISFPASVWLLTLCWHPRLPQALHRIPPKLASCPHLWGGSHAIEHRLAALLLTPFS